MEFLGLLNFALSIAIGLLLLVFLVVIHELGHAIAARRNGVVVEEFGIGFPPKAWGKKLKNGILFTLNWLPLGGFVKLKGEHDSDTNEGSYGAASLWAKTKILLAGVVINWLAAALIFTVLALFGLPKALPNQFTVPQDTHITRDKVVASVVVKNSPAEKAGLKAGDKILVLAGEEIDNTDELFAVAKKNAGKTVTLAYSREGQERAADIALNADNGQNKGFVGIGPLQQERIRATWSAPIVGIGTTAQFTWVTFQGLGQLLANVGQGLASKLSPDESVRQRGAEALGEANQGVAGPVGILGQIFPAAREAGLTTLLFLTGIISLTLAVMNVLPIPALDGGRLFVTLLFRGLKKPLTKEREEKIHATGFIALMALVLLITVLDIGKLSGN